MKQTVNAFLETPLVVVVVVYSSISFSSLLLSLSHTLAHTLTHTNNKKARDCSAFPSALSFSFFF
jgi:hypothetical protein